MIRPLRPCDTRGRAGPDAEAFTGLRDEIVAFAHDETPIYYEELEYDDFVRDQVAGQFEY